MTMLTTGSDRSMNPLLALNVPSLEDIIRQGDQLTRDIGENASIQHCISASFAIAIYG